MKDKETSWVYLILLLPPIFWAGNSVLARAVADLIPAIALSFWRWTLALAVLLPFTWRLVLRDWPAIRRSWLIVFLLGLFGIGSFNTLLYTAAHTTTVINIALAQAVMPAVIVLMSFVLYRDRIAPRQLFAIVLCMAGAGYVVIHGDLDRLLAMKIAVGDLLMLLAVVLYAAYSVLLRKRPAIHPLSFLTATFAVGVVLLLPLYLWEAQSTPPLTLSQPVVLSLLYVAICPSILAYLCWNRGIQEIGANRAGLYINLIPLFAALMAVGFLGERFQTYHLVGILMIAAGLVLFNIPLKRKKG